MLLSVSFLLTDFCFSQTKAFDTLQNQIDNENYNEALSFLSRIDTISFNKYDKGLWYFYSGELNLIIDKHDNSFKAFLNSREKFSSIDSLNDAADCDLKIVQVLSHQNNIEAAKPFLDRYVDYAESKNNSKMLSDAYLEVGSMYWNIDKSSNAIAYFKKAITESKKTNDTLKIASLEFNIGVVHNTDLNQPDSALYYFKKTLPTFLKYKRDNYISYNYNNQAKAYVTKKNYTKAIELYQKANAISLNKFDQKTRVVYYENMANAYDKTKDYKNAALYLNKFIALKDSINDKAQNIAINETNKKYNTEKIRADKLEVEAANKQLETYNLKIEADNKSKNTQLIVSLFILTLVIISAYLIQKNTRKKQLLAEQAKDLETQKVTTLLQEQELSSIDAMIQGQEKERKRIAEDLHDDLGALMATVKLHFENIETAQNEEAVQKTSALLDEAYTKIRTIAHAKNAGVIANQGLLVAVENMAAKISSANKLDIEVIAHGLEDRLENSLELSLFRMIQELIANIIKHAEATNATIQLTQYEKNLNIIVEDNGKGFNHTTIKTTGIGLESIKRRIEHLNGNLTIDSTPTKGTTILVDVPLT